MSFASLFTYACMSTIDEIVSHSNNELVFCYRSDDRTLESYSINAGATIHMVLQLRGGEC